MDNFSFADCLTNCFERSLSIILKSKSCVTPAGGTLGYLLPRPTFLWDDSTFPLEYIYHWSNQVSFELLVSSNYGFNFVTSASIH